MASPLAIVVQDAEMPSCLVLPQPKMVNPTNNYLFLDWAHDGVQALQLSQFLAGGSRGDIEFVSQVYQM